MKVIISLINIWLISFCFGFTPTPKDLEVAKEIKSQIGNIWDLSLKGYIISDESSEIIQRFSPKERVRGLATLVFMEDKDPAKGGKASTGKDYFNVVSKNKKIFNDIRETRKILFSESSPRGVYLMAILASRISKEKRGELIPILFNSLFKDGKVTKKEGEYTRAYWDDISKFSYEWIVSFLKKEGYDYVPASGNLDHEAEALNLASWLIENWPGCENYQLSDQNTPVFLSKEIIGSRRKRDSSGNVVSASNGEKNFVFSWPMGVALLLFISSLGYLVFKKYSNQPS